MKNLLPFYRDVLGLQVGFESPGFVVLGELEAPALALGTHSEVHGRNADPARHMVGLATDDVRTEWKRLKAAGVEFVEDPTDLRQPADRDLEGPGGEPGPAAGAAEDVKRFYGWGRERNQRAAGIPFGWAASGF